MLVSIKNNRMKACLQVVFLLLVIRCTAIGACPEEDEHYLPDVDPGAANYSVSVSAGNVIRPVSPAIHGLHIFWRVNCMGMVEDQQSSIGPLAYHAYDDTSSGNVPCLKARFDELHPRLLVFPSNYESLTYNFRDGLGPRQDNTPSATDTLKRPTRMFDVPASRVNGPFPEHMGTDEFVDLCSSIDAVPMLAINLCGKRICPTNMSNEDWRQSAQLAANWVEYCNGRITTNIKQRAQAEGWQTTTWAGVDPNKVEVKVPGKSWLSTETAPPGYFAWLRGNFGHQNPYNVRYWKIGEEPYWLDYPWATADMYRDSFVRIADAMETVDPQIKIVIQVMTRPDGVSQADKNNQSGKKWNATVLGADGSSGTVAYQTADIIDAHEFPGPMSVYGELFYWCNGRFQRTANIVEGGNCIVRAKMKNAGGTTNVLLEIDGVPQFVQPSACTWEVGADQYADYDFQTYLSPGLHELKLVECNYASRLYIASVKVIWGGIETILLDRAREYDKIFGAQELALDYMQKLLDTYPEKQLMIGQSNVSYGGQFRDIPEDDREDSLSVNRVKGALGVLHLTNRLIRMQSAHSTNGVFGRCHWHFCERAAFDTDKDGTTNYGWETTGWRIAYHDFVDGQDRIGVTATFHFLKAYSAYAVGSLVKCDTVSKQFAVPLNRDFWWNDERYLDYVDAIALKSGKYVRILVTNRDTVPYDFKVNLSGFNRKSAYVTVYRYAGESMESDVVNTSSQSLRLSNSFRYTFPPCSLVVLEFK